jgi:hypothetical protein
MSDHEGWRCSGCATLVADGSGFRVTLDPRIRLGWCLECEARRPWKAVAGPEPVVAVSVPARAPAGAYEAGIAASELAARHRWTFLERLQVDGAIRAVAGRLAEFTADDVWSELGAEFPVTKGLAGRLNAAMRAGLIRASGRVTVSRRSGDHGHAQRLGVWVPGRRGAE